MAFSEFQLWSYLSPNSNNKTKVGAHSNSFCFLACTHHTALYCVLCVLWIWVSPHQQFPQMYVTTSFNRVRAKRAHSIPTHTLNNVGVRSTHTQSLTLNSRDVILQLVSLKTAMERYVIQLVFVVFLTVRSLSLTCGLVKPSSSGMVYLLQPLSFSMCSHTSLPTRFVVYVYCSV